jgi:hypothetical protein
MTKGSNPKRIKSKDVVPKGSIILKSTSPDLLWVGANPSVVTYDDTGYELNKYLGGPVGGEGIDGVDLENLLEKENSALPVIDTVDMTDIENLTFEEYVDPSTKITKYNVYIKIRNGSSNSASVAGIDARIYDAASSSYAPSTTPTYVNPASFTTPTPTVPSVIFDRVGTAIAWGWNDSSGFGSYSSISYEWVITTLKTGGTTISEGSSTYPSSSTYAIGSSGKTRKYRVSSAQGNTPASSSARWLKVRTVVVGTNGKNYYSAYSTAI